MPTRRHVLAGFIAAPLFTRLSPEKQDFSSDVPGGEKMTIAGYVLAEDCKPVAKALVEFRHADKTGAYDNNGYKLRGHHFTDAKGRWWFDTILPGSIRAAPVTFT